MAESTDTTVEEKEVSSETVSVETDGFGESAVSDEVVLEVKKQISQA